MHSEHNDKPVTMVFVDYESWFFGLFNSYSETPDVEPLIRDLKERGRLKDIYFFGDFSLPQLAAEKQKLRTVTNQIIDCGTEGAKKDFTDFIMLDQIYKVILQDTSADIQQYVLVTGDGHFHSVVAFLTTFMDRQVGIYAVKGTLSRQLRDCASWHVEIEPQDSLEQYQKALLGNINHVLEKKDGTIPTFSGTVQQTARHYRLNETRCRAALKRLISQGLVSQEKQRLPNGDGITALVPHWNRVQEEGLQAVQPQAFS